MNGVELGLVPRVITVAPVCGAGAYIGCFQISDLGVQIADSLARELCPELIEGDGSKRLEAANAGL